MGEKKCHYELGRLHDPTRFDEIERLHQQAFAWQPQGRIPLGIHVANPVYTKHVSYEQWLDPKVFLPIQTQYLIDTLTVGSDLLPVVAVNHTGNAHLASMFGAKLYIPESTSATLQDVGPTPLPILDNIDQADTLKLPQMDTGIMPDLEYFGRLYREHLPEWVHVVGPMPMGPLSTAMELRGSEMLLELIDRPAACKKLILLCAELECRVTQRFRAVVGAQTGHTQPTNFAVASPGVRLGDDSICNMSSNMIQEFCGPSYAWVNERCGGIGHVHFCSLIDSRFEHIYETLHQMPEVAIVSSQFGFEYYQEHLDDLRGRLAVESFYGDAYRYVCEQFGSFADWANQFVPHYKNESGLVLYMQVSSIEEGKAIWTAWQKAHAR